MAVPMYLLGIAVVTPLCVVPCYLAALSGPRRRVATAGLVLGFSPWPLGMLIFYVVQHIIGFTLEE